MFARRQRRVRQLELCNRDMFGDLILTCQSTPFPIISQVPYHVRPPEKVQKNVQLKVHDVKEARGYRKNDSEMDRTPRSLEENEKRRASVLVDQLLMDIYTNTNNATDYNSTTSSRSRKSLQIEASNLADKDVDELLSLIGCLEDHVVRIGGSLVRQLKRRDALRRQRDAHCDVITNHLCKRAPENTDMRFTIQPAPGESGFSQWASAMKMVSQLPGGIPPEFRRRLWLTLAEKHLASKGVDWERVKRNCFSEWSHPTDAELGVQIVKDLHRTGCSLFCGEDGQENQALLKKVLLAYARWNKSVGYCQGFNMLAALILQVTDRDESDALKVMIYLIEGVLPESYFADSLRGLSVDMAVFRELLRSKLPHLSRHLDALQAAAKEGTTSYEPPLTNVFTMQWFLTLFCNCLPQPTVLRVWDLIFLEGNEMLLRTALAIWQTLADRILSVKSADEFYCIMGVLTRELLEFGLIDANSLIKSVVTIGSLSELKSLREHYLYNINPWGSSLSSISESEKQLKLYPRERLVLDISALKKQYAKLKQRHRQAHIIFNAAVTRQPPRAAPVAMNHLLLGKSALVPAKRIGPPKGSIPPARQPPSTLHWKDTPQSAASSSSSSDTELCDDPGEASSEEDEVSKNSQFEIDNPTETGDKTDLMTEDNTIRENYSATLEQRATLVTDSSNFISDVPLGDDFDKSRLDLVGDVVEAAKISGDSSLVESTNLYDFDSTEQTANAIEEDDTGFDFEKFLEERVRCLKTAETSPDDDGDEESELKRIEFGRRNSQRALQIMQENSLILHRILQCQPILSPSPPVVQDEPSTCSYTDPKEEYKDDFNGDFEKSYNYKPSLDDLVVKDTFAYKDHQISSDSISSLTRLDEASETQTNPNNTSDRSIKIKFDVSEDFSFGAKLKLNVDNSKNYEFLLNRSEDNIHKFSMNPTSPLDTSDRESKDTPTIDFCRLQNDNGDDFEFGLHRIEISDFNDAKHQEESSLSELDTFKYDFDPLKYDDGELEKEKDTSLTVFKNISSSSKGDFSRLDTLNFLLTGKKNIEDREYEENVNVECLDETKTVEEESHEGLFDSIRFDFENDDRSVLGDDSKEKNRTELVTNDDITYTSDDFTQQTSKYSSILEYSKNLDEKYNNLILNAGNTKMTSDLSSTASTSDDPKKEEDPDKSPVFNPFPVKISTRQNKDVAVRLGLYKK